MVESGKALGDHAGLVAEGRRPARRALRAVLAVALWASLGQPAVLAAAPGSQELLSASVALAAPGPIEAGDTLSLSGSLSAAPPCLEGRTVLLEARPAGQEGWSPAGQTVTGADGGFASTFSPTVNTRYRAVVPEAHPEGTACDSATSEPIQARVRARVLAGLSKTSVAAGGCLRVRVNVSPSKQGQEVWLQRRKGDRWAPAGTGVLDADSRTALRLCPGWSDIGAVRLRVVWPAQDELNVRGESPTRRVDVLRAPWMQRIDALVAGRAVSIAAGEAGAFLYQRADTVARIPASNEKLLLSMALLDRLGPDFRVRTRAAAARVRGGIVRGNLWILGRGDPGTRRADLRELAQRLVEAGIRRVRGSVMGSTAYFARDWWAPGWRWNARWYVALPTALTFRGNTAGGRHVRDPERRAAAALTRRLEALGVRVSRPPRAGRPATGLETLALVRSRPLQDMLTRMNRDSVNFSAEVLGKLLGAGGAGPPGTIAKGAAAIQAWARAQGVRVRSYDASGLSYDNRMTARGMVRLLSGAEEATWGETLRESLPSSGEGTLEDRLEGLAAFAKTGSLRGVSALSGWVWLERVEAWGEFSILSRGMTKAEAVRIEDAVARILSGSAR